MGMTIWTEGSDPYDHDQLATNFTKLDAHDHTSTKGKQIPTGGIADGAVTNAKIATGIDGSKISSGTIPGSALASGAVPSSFKFYESHTWAVPGAISAPTGTPTQNYLPPFYVALRSGTQSAKLVSCFYVVEQGSVTATLRKKTWGGSESDVTGFTSIGVTTTDATTDPTDVTLADKDRLRLVLSSPTSSPWNLSFSIIIEHTITSS